MKDKRIIFSFRKGINNVDLKLIYENINNEFDCKWIAFYQDSLALPYCDLILDPLFNPPFTKFEFIKKYLTKSVGPVNKNKFISLYEEIEAFAPNLIIVDFEPILTAIGNSLNIPVWNCSSLNLNWGVLSDYQYRSYKSKIKPFKQNWKKRKLKLNKKLIYSPFFKFDIPLLEGFEWTKPFFTKVSLNDNVDFSLLYKRTKDLDKIFYNYSKHPNLEKISNVIFTTGENDLINQIVLNDAAKTINILPDLKNIETLINANIISHYKLGQDLGQLELMEDWANNYLDVAKNYHSNAIINPNADAGTLLQKIKEFYDNENIE